MKYVKLFESFNEKSNNPLESLISFLKAEKVPHTVKMTEDPEIEDDSIELDEKFHVQISAYDAKPYTLWMNLEDDNMKELGTFSDPKEVIKKYNSEK